MSAAINLATGRCVERPRGVSRHGPIVGNAKQDPPAERISERASGRAKSRRIRQSLLPLDKEILSVEYKLLKGWLIQGSKERAVVCWEVRAWCNRRGTSALLSAPHVPARSNQSSLVLRGRRMPPMIAFAYSTAW